MNKYEELKTKIKGVRDELEMLKYRFGNTKFDLKQVVKKQQEISERIELLFEKLDLEVVEHPAKTTLEKKA